MRIESSAAAKAVVAVATFVFLWLIARYIVGWAFYTADSRILAQASISIALISAFLLAGGLVKRVYLRTMAYSLTVFIVSAVAYVWLSVGAVDRASAISVLILIIPPLVIAAITIHVVFYVFSTSWRGTFDYMLQEPARGVLFAALLTSFLAGSGVALLADSAMKPLDAFSVNEGCDVCMLLENWLGIHDSFRGAVFWTGVALLIAAPLWFVIALKRRLYGRQSSAMIARHHHIDAVAKALLVGIAVPVGGILAGALGLLPPNAIRPAVPFFLGAPYELSGLELLPLVAADVALWFAVGLSVVLTTEWLVRRASRSSGSPTGR